MVDVPSADGDQTRSDYAMAVASRTGPTRYEPATGRMFIPDRITLTVQGISTPASVGLGLTRSTSASRESSEAQPAEG
jgi:hypothetical protein